MWELSCLKNLKYVIYVSKCRSKGLLWITWSSSNLPINKLAALGPPYQRLGNEHRNIFKNLKWLLFKSNRNPVEDFLSCSDNISMLLNCLNEADGTRSASNGSWCCNNWIYPNAKISFTKMDENLLKEKNVSDPWLVEEKEVKQSVHFYLGF